MKTITHLTAMALTWVAAGTFGYYVGLFAARTFKFVFHFHTGGQ